VSTSYELTPEQQEARRRLLYDTPFWAKHCAVILDKRRQPVRLNGYPWQLEFDAALEKQRAAGLPMRAIILKARKLGFSTWVAAKMLQRVTQLEHQIALIVAQDVKTAGQIFDMGKLIYTRLPTADQLGLGFDIRPVLTGSSFAPNGRKFMSFSTEHSRKLRLEGLGAESLLEIDTAGGATAAAGGRGYTPSLFHGSEVAWWPQPGKLVSLLNALPDEPETMAVLESTAQGFNHFHTRWELAVAGEEDPEMGGGTFVPLFYGWHRNPYNKQEFATPEARERFVASIGTGDYGKEEPDLIALYGVTPEQLLWRRSTIREKCENSIEVFHQEHPATPEEAFIGSGTPVFGGLLVAAAMKAAVEAPAPTRGMLEGADFEERRTRGGSLLVPRRAVWVPEAECLPGQELIRVWEHPVKGGRDTVTADLTLEAVEQRLEQLEAERAHGDHPGQYVAFVDVALGEGNTFEDGDFHAIQVFDHVTKMQVARYRSRVAIHELPMIVFLIALYWNQAWLAVEVNGPGLAVAEPLKRDLRYPRLYRRIKVDSQTGREEDLIGWSTDRKTKPLMELAMGTALQEDSHGIRDVLTARELTTYVSDEKGRHGALAGAHDDLLIAAMGCHRVMDVVRPRDFSAPAAGRLAGWQPSDDLR
jgi:hypothetical protein